MTEWKGLPLGDVNPHYTHLPTSFERFRCELNRKKPKFECNGLWFRQVDFDRLSRGDHSNGSKCGD